MKSIRTALLTSALIAGFAGLAMAETIQTDKPRSARMEKMHEYKAKRQNAHLLDLKTQLNLQEAQNGAWAQYKQAMARPQHTTRPSRTAMANMTTPERLKQMQSMTAVKNEHMQKRVASTQALYDSLTTDQQKVFDKATAPNSKKGMHGMGHQKGHGFGERG